jgi:hypothetical protein
VVSSLIAGVAGFNGLISAGAQTPRCDALTVALANATDPALRALILGQMVREGCTIPSTTTSSIASSTTTTVANTTTTAAPTTTTTVPATTTTTSIPSSTTTTTTLPPVVLQTCAVLRQLRANSTDPTVNANLDARIAALHCPPVNNQTA